MKATKLNSKAMVRVLTSVVNQLNKLISSLEDKSVEKVNKIETSSRKKAQSKIWVFMIGKKKIISSNNHTQTLINLLHKNKITSFKHKDVEFKDGKFKNLGSTADPKTRCKQILEATGLEIKASWSYHD